MKARASEPSRSLNALAQLYVEYLMQRPSLRELLNNLRPLLTILAPLFCSSICSKPYRFDEPTDLPRPET